MQEKAVKRQHNWNKQDGIPQSTIHQTRYLPFSSSATSQTVKRSFSLESMLVTERKNFIFNRNEHASELQERGNAEGTGWNKKKKKIGKQKKKKERKGKRKTRKKIKLEPKGRKWEKGVVKSSPRSYKAGLFIISLPARMPS